MEPLYSGKHCSVNPVSPLCLSFSDEKLSHQKVKCLKQRWKEESNPDCLRRACASLPLYCTAVCKYCREYTVSSNCGTLREECENLFL